MLSSFDSFPAKVRRWSSKTREDESRTEEAADISAENESSSRNLFIHRRLPRSSVCNCIFIRKIASIGKNENARSGKLYFNFYGKLERRICIDIAKIRLIPVSNTCEILAICSIQNFYLGSLCYNIYPDYYSFFHCKVFVYFLFNVSLNILIKSAMLWILMKRPIM